MEIAPKYDPKLTEEKWYQHWLSHDYFKSRPDHREPYTIVIPPPNVTGVLHMGHMLNNTIQDVLIRRQRMMGKNTLWLPGTDHASIATEAKVVDKLRKEGIEKSSLSREEFLSHAWEWKEKHGGIILEQLKKLGASCDWERTRFTMDENMYKQVINVFIDLYNKGLIYKGARMVNWDPKALTAVSDEEVIYREVQSKLYYVRYQVEGANDEWITIATTRPETILGDTAICVHPEDERYRRLLGKRVLVPLINRSIPIIKDEYVDREFGTGALKVTPAHDINDYNLGIKHHLETIDTFNDNGTMSEAAQLYIGEDRFIVREKISSDLQAKGHMVKIEDYVNKVGFSERTHEVIEPRLSTQWFMRMHEMAKPALDIVMDDTIKFHPAKFKNTYRHWMENVKDWCISRQLWWGHRIPAYYLPDGQIIVAGCIEKAIEEAEKLTGKLISKDDLKQDDDVLDTWFSSWLWPMSVFDGLIDPENPDILYYYPTNDLVTAPEILFFWVARMIMAGLEYRKDIPFKNVYLTGIVRDKQGRKMSKSLGNSPDPLLLIEKFGADGVRIGMLLTSPAGNDLPFDEDLCEQGRNFSNKIWNALRLINGWKEDKNIPQPEYAKAAVRWFESRLNKEIAIIEDHFSKYRLSDALMATYKLIWDDFCSWYLEMVKPAYQQPIDSHTLEQSIGYFETLIKLLHPFMPFITEEIWHTLAERKEGDDLILAKWPEMNEPDEDLLSRFEFVEEVITQVRTIRKEKNILQKDALRLMIKKNLGEKPDELFDPVLSKLCNIEIIEYVNEKVSGAISFVARSTEFFIPLTETLDIEAEILKLEEEIRYTQGFLASVMKKLNNQGFVNNASAMVVELENKKKLDAEAKIQVISEQIRNLRKN